MNLTALLPGDQEIADRVQRRDKPKPDPAAGDAEREQRDADQREYDRADVLARNEKAQHSLRWGHLHVLDQGSRRARRPLAIPPASARPGRARD